MADSTTAYKDTYTTFSGCDIVCSFGSQIIGETFNKELCI